MKALSEIYISQSEIESTSQNNQSENRFLSVVGVVLKKAWQPPCDMIDSVSTDILPLFGIDELNCSLEQFWNVSSTKNIVWQ